MALDDQWKNKENTHTVQTQQESSKTPQNEYPERDTSVDSYPRDSFSGSSGSNRGMQETKATHFVAPGQLLKTEDVETFFNHLEHHPVGVTSTSHLPNSSTAYPQSNMFQNPVAMTSMAMHSTPPTYHETTQNSFLPGTQLSSPVYVPTTRAMLPVQYPGAPQAPQTNAWSMQDASYSTGTAHPSSRFSFPPTPSPPMASPTGRTDSTPYGASLSRSTGISPYSPYMHTTSDIPHWNAYNMNGGMAAQKAWRPGDFGEFFRNV